MKRTSSVLFAAALLATGTVAMPAFAATSEPTAAAATSAIEKPAAQAKRYCIVDTPTGTRIEHKTCKSRDAWMRQGFDPLAKK